MRRHARSPIFLSSSLYGAQKDAGGARSAGIMASKAAQAGPGFLGAPVDFWLGLDPV